MARFTGVQTCGSVWACPVCSAKIRQGRAEELEAGVAAHLEAGGGAFFVTLTVRHDRGDSLKDLLDLVAGTWRSLAQGGSRVVAPGQGGLLGVVRALEITHGSHGWHPHLHVLGITDRPWSDDEVAAYGDMLFDRWASRIRRKMPSASPVREAFRCQPVSRSGRELAHYLTKIQDGGSLGLEMTRGDLKAGRQASRTPFELAGVAAQALRATGELVPEWDLWHEYESTTRGRRALTWSKGLRRYLAGLSDGVDEVERSDDELAAEAPASDDDQVLIVFDRAQWSRILAVPDLRCDLLEAAEDGQPPDQLLRLIPPWPSRRSSVR